MNPIEAVKFLLLFLVAWTSIWQLWASLKNTHHLKQQAKAKREERERMLKLYSAGDNGIFGEPREDWLNRLKNADVEYNPNGPYISYVAPKEKPKDLSGGFTMRSVIVPEIKPDGSRVGSNIVGQRRPMDDDYSGMMKR